MSEIPGFKEIDKLIKCTYYNSEGETVKKFMLPVLKRSKEYKRTSWCWSSAVFSLLNEAFMDIVNNDCQVYYIIGMQLQESELGAIEKGLESPDELIEQELIKEYGLIENLFEELGRRQPNKAALFRHRMNVLSYLVSKGQLHFRIGFRTRGGKILNPGRFKFHPKVMIFNDFHGDSIVTNGSINESFAGLSENEESFDVFKSWDEGTRNHFNRHVKKFEEFWNNTAKGVKTISISKVLEAKIFSRLKPDYRHLSKDEINRIEDELTRLLEDEELEKEFKQVVGEEEELTEPTPFTLRPYQDLVVTNWVKSGKKGIYELATGAGKTICAIESINRHLQAVQSSIVIIVCPTRALCEQWVEKLYGLTDYKPILAYESQHTWFSSLNHKLLAFGHGNVERILVVTTLATYSLAPFQKSMEAHWESALVVFDECHHVASTTYKRVLLQGIPYRLGLSATPENEGNEAGNRVLHDFFKQITPEPYVLGEAIKAGYLNDYSYFPILNELDDSEKEGFEDLLGMILRARKSNDNQTLLQLYRERDNQLDTAKTKIPNLVKLLNKMRDELVNISHTIIYCSGNQQLTQVSHVLKDMGIKFGKITARENAPIRKKVLTEFKKGYVQVLLGIRVLDEGIDIPAVNTAIILKSSTRTRQSIQRRGRCLRTLTDQEGKRLPKNVSIYDFVVIPRYNFTDSGISDVNDTIINDEYNRIMEFISLAKNSESAKKTIEQRRNVVI